MDQLDFIDLDTVEIPDKTTFKIGEVAKLLDLEPYVLRYWEEQFEVLQPAKTKSGQRSYQRQDIELLATIQRLLYTEQFTIDGARRQLELTRQGKPSYLNQTMAASSSDSDDGDEIESQRVAELEEANAHLRDDLSHAHAKLEEAEEIRQRLRDERNEFRKRAQNLEDELDDVSESDTEGLESTVEKWKEAAERLQQEVESLEGDLDEARSTIEALEKAEQEETGGSERRSELLGALRREVVQLAEFADRV